MIEYFSLAIRKKLWLTCGIVLLNDCIMDGSAVSMRSCVVYKGGDGFFLNSNNNDNKTK